MGHLRPQVHKTESGENIHPVDDAAVRSSLAGDGGAIVLDFCNAVRGILNDNHGGPRNPPGIRMVNALADAQESLARIAASGKCGPAFSLLDRLKGFIDRGVAEQQDTFSRVRGYTAQVREVVEILTVEDGSSLADREPLFAAKISPDSPRPPLLKANSHLSNGMASCKKPVQKKKITPESIGSPYPQSQ